MWNASAPVVVAIDGSDAAINAALWAIDEATSRDVPLRMVHATRNREAARSWPTTFTSRPRTPKLLCARPVAAVEAVGNPLKIETEILWGPVKSMLIAESRNAAMMCVGSSGIGAVAHKLFGSTALALAEEAYCPVAIIRTR